MKLPNALSRWVVHLVCGAQLLATTAFIWFDPTRQQPTPPHSYTQQDSNRIEKTLQETGPSTDWIVLPAFANATIVDSTMYGSLTMRSCVSHLPEHESAQDGERTVVNQ